MNHIDKKLIEEKAPKNSAVDYENHRNIPTTDMDKKIAEKVKEIELLKKEKEVEELRIEIEKLKKTVVEEIIIKREIIIQKNCPHYPQIGYPSQTWPYDHYQITC
ncbi:MAG: hypothetical protein KGI27_13005 [Thaumarchaeota archaeon]|nr:hypothetical protein [Nitrososphaerota archaeon]